MANKNKWKGKRQALTWLLIVVMLLSGTNVLAAEFDAPDGVFSEGEFSSGEDDAYAEPVITGSTEASAEVTITPEALETADLQEEAAVFSYDGDGNAESVPNPEEESISAEDMEIFQADSQGENSTETAASVKVVFADQNGKAYDNLTITSKLGASIILPGVPGCENVPESGWKLDPDASDSDAVQYARSAFVLDGTKEDVTEHIKDGVLTFYAVEGKYTVYFYKNGGTGKALKTMKVSPGTKITLPDVPNSKYVNFGWTDTPKGTSVKYKIGASYTVNQNTNFYIIRYAASRVKTVTFLSPTGASSSAFKALTAQVVKGTKLTLPAVPAKTGYTGLGWSLKKNAKSAAYAVGKTITVTKNMTIYAVRKKLPSYKVTFNNNSGTSTSKTYTAMTQKIYRGNYITLPAVPAASGYENLGWTTTKGGKTPLYKAGAKVKVTGSMKFYAVRQKAVYYTASFYSRAGKTNSTYKALSRNVLAGTSITLPSVPAKSGYISLGWSTKKKATVAAYKAGATLKISKNMKLYAVQVKAATVILHQNSGTVWKTYTVAEGASLTLPGVQNKTGYTMMGWSKTSGKSVNPDYEVGETLSNLKGTTKLYAVVFQRSTEPDYSADNLPQADLRKYKQIIFVGDSRMNRMQNTLNSLGNTSLTSGISFICKEGGGLSWLQSEGYAALLKQVGDGSQSILEKKTVVIFNLGVNDLSKSYSYVTYLRSIASELQKKGCILYYMSVNPVNLEMIKALGKNAERKEADVRSFNEVIKSNLCSGTSKLYTYIDCYGYLMRNGFGTDRNRYGADEGVDDGLHYTTKTYKRIYKYCMGIIS